MFGSKYETFEFSLAYVEENGFPLAPLYLPKLSNDSFSIEHRDYDKGERVFLVDARMAILTGLSPTALTLDFPWTSMILHEITEDNKRIWMSTVPVETFTHIYPALNAHGDVLVGGLGLGYVLQMMDSLNDRVKRITCVEISQDLVDLISGYFPNVEFVVSDIFDYMKTTDKKFDFVYLDTWSRTSERVFIETVYPLRNLAEGVLTETSSSVDINCWMEEVMRGQFVFGIHAGLMVSDEIIKKSLEDGYKRVNPVAGSFFEKFGIDYLRGLEPEALDELAISYVDEY